MNLDPKYSGLVTEKWQDAFTQFIQTGEANDEFLNYLDNDKKAQEAVEMAFTEQAKGFQNLAEELKTKGNVPLGRAGAAGDISIRIAGALAETLKVSEEKREAVLQEAATALTTKMKPTDKIVIREFVSSLGDTLSKMT